MAKKLKLTAFSRFIFVLVLIVPLAYIGASYYNGEDGIQNIKELIGLNENFFFGASGKFHTISKE